MRVTWLWACVCAVAVWGAACGKDPEVAKREFLRSGDKYVAEGKLNEASIEYRNAIQQDPRFGEARFKLGEVLLKLDNLPGAYREFVRAADLLPRDLKAQLQVAALHIAAEQFEDAEASAKKALDIEPKNLAAKVALANAYAGMKHHEQAIKEMKEVIQADPTRTLAYANLGTLQLIAGRTEEAEASFREGVRLGPTSVEARTELALFLMRTDRTKEGEAVLSEALSLAPKDVRANSLLASLYVATSRIARAEGPLKVIAEASGDRDSKLRLADFYRLSGRNSDALLLMKSLELEPSNYVAAKAREAVIQLSNGNAAGARAAAEAALAKDPKNVEALLVKSDLLLSENKPEEALRVAESAALADGDAIQAHYAIGRLRRRLGQTDGAITAFNDVLRLSPRDVPARLELSRAYLNAGRPKDTLEVAQSVLSSQPGNPDALLLQARGLMGTGDLAGAERPTSTLVKQYPSAAIVHVQLGDLQRQKRNTAAARAAYERALTIDARNVDALTGILTIDVREGRAVEARKRVDAALAAEPKSVPLLLLSSRVSAEGGDFAAAERTLRRAFDLAPANTEVYALLGQVYRSQGKIDQAIAEYEHLASRSANPAGVHTLIGMLLEGQNKLDAAREKYEKALGLDGENAVAANNLAWLIAEHGGNLDIALQLAQTAKAKLPESAAISDTLGWVYYKKGLFDQAVTAFQLSVAKEPKVAAFHYHLGLSSAKSGDTRLARASLEEALRLQPSGSQADATRAALAALPTS
jgi:tetratricopeptide (TPR) repeat protein